MLFESSPGCTIEVSSNKFPLLCTVKLARLKPPQGVCFIRLLEIPFSCYTEKQYCQLAELHDLFITGLQLLLGLQVHNQIFLISFI